VPTPTNVSDARRHPRFAVQIDAKVTAPDGEQMTAITKDMSRGGICVVCPKRIVPGSTVGLSLSLILGDNSFSESLELSARVVWCTPIAQVHQVGAVFTGLTREKAGFLEMFLRFLQQEVLVTGPGEPPTLARSPFDTGDEDT
jgi:Tfp pilus assembly protein PilZ